MSTRGESRGAVNDLQLASGARVRVRYWAGEGLPLVLLHGLFDDSRGWAQTAAGSERPCYAIDLPGFGGSDPAPAARVAAYAQIVREALEALDVRACVLVGHSFGGAVAGVVAELTDAVAGLVLLAPTGFGVNCIAEALAVPPLRALATLALPWALLNPLVVTAVYGGMVAPGRMPPPPMLAHLRARAFTMSHAVAPALQAIVADGPGRGREVASGARCRGHVLAVWGARDQLVPPGHSTAVLHAFPQARLEVWRGMGHHPQHERRRRLGTTLERHASGASRGRR